MPNSGYTPGGNDVLGAGDNSAPSAPPIGASLPQGQPQSWQPGADPNAQNWGNPTQGIGTSSKASAYQPIDEAQQAQAYVDPYAAANNAAIQQGYGNLLNGYGKGGSSLAGLTQLGAVTNANAANIDTGQSNALLGGQVANINALNAQAQGQGPSVAAMQAQQQGQANIAATMAMAGSQRGSSNSGLGLRAAQDANAQSNQQAIQAGVLGRTQEELSAQQQLTGALSGTQGQVQQGAQAQASLTQQANLQNAGAANASTLQQGSMDQSTTLANLQAQLQAGQINIGQYNSMLQAQMAQSANDFGAQQNYASLVTGENTQMAGLEQGLAINESNNNMGLVSAGIGGLSGLAGGIASAASSPQGSDIKLKKEIRPAARSIKEFLSQISESASRGGFALMGGR